MIAQAIVPHLSGEITLGNLLATGSFLAAAYAAWRDMGWRVKNLETWKVEHEKVTRAALQTLSNTSTLAAELTRIAEGQDRRLVLLEGGRR